LCCPLLCSIIKSVFTMALQKRIATFLWWFCFGLAQANRATSAIYVWSVSSVHPQDHSAVDHDKQFQVECTVLRTQTLSTTAISAGGCHLKKMSPAGDWLKVPSTPELTEALGIDESQPILVQSCANGSTAGIWHMDEDTSSLNT